TADARRDRQHAHRPARSPRGAVGLRKRPRDVPAADHAVRRHARPVVCRPPARPVGRHQRRRRRADEANRVDARARSPLRAARGRDGGRPRRSARAAGGAPAGPGANRLAPRMTARLAPLLRGVLGLALPALTIVALATPPLPVVAKILVAAVFAAGLWNPAE